MALSSVFVPSTPTTIHEVRARDCIECQLVNDDPTQSIDVTVWRTFATDDVAARISDEQFTGLQPGEARVGSIAGLRQGVNLLFKAQASGAGNAPLRYWFSQ